MVKLMNSNFESVVGRENIFKLFYNMIMLKYERSAKTQTHYVNVIESLPF